LPIGHIRQMATLPVGTQTRLTLSAYGARLEMDNPAYFAARKSPCSGV